jgi:hypothetical protein
MGSELEQIEELIAKGQELEKLEDTNENKIDRIIVSLEISYLSAKAMQNHFFLIQENLKHTIEVLGELRTGTI